MANVFDQLPRILGSLLGEEVFLRADGNAYESESGIRITREELMRARGSEPEFAALLRAKVRERDERTMRITRSNEAQFRGEQPKNVPSGPVWYEEPPMKNKDRDTMARWMKREEEMLRRKEVRDQDTWETQKRVILPPGAVEGNILRELSLLRQSVAEIRDALRNVEYNMDRFGRDTYRATRDVMEKLEAIEKSGVKIAGSKSDRKKGRAYFDG